MGSNPQENNVIIFMAIGIVVMLLMALSLVLFFLLSQRKLNNAKIREQALELEHQQDLMQQNLLVQEEERQRIAAQLHDDIGSKLGVISLTFHRLRRLDEPDDEKIVIYEEVNDLIANTLEDTRRISHELLPPTLEDFGLKVALEEFCENVRKTGAVAIDLDYQLEKGAVKELRDDLNLFRIIQEMTSNTLKYAGASRIIIRFLQIENTRQLSYSDDGKGFDPADIKGKGLGMKNLENRVRMLKGTSTIKTAPGEGFAITISF